MTNTSPLNKRIYKFKNAQMLGLSTQNVRVTRGFKRESKSQPHFSNDNLETCGLKNKQTNKQTCTFITKSTFYKMYNEKRICLLDHRISWAEVNANCLPESLMKPNCWLELSPLTLVTAYTPFINLIQHNPPSLGLL